ncbi:MAG: 3-deoxy-8-phosphooctulonate synthase [Fimbriimonadaceae bacterium]|nr:MAG: 2-dehydro-3-deoxyphosphooctonate aldolase [Armatimonadetes bacterium OLB18]MBV6489982.1 2-dehydro-3-deoxyphosphooctonate aldolase [Fimbriimonadaceae bacterium]MCL4284865.1 3-deoxy-8-phosphooctulonate synthase [Fimbriimonadaceae bacterium]QOJ12415.1 MAG: 3-deoxy-8-phosphooctulonate synthase [Chthonomonadaceae bacterium]WKZ80503.1 MAG: 3-deoxy-8-phosphooctulonate synthase [Fimbriimonadaceae bacterium]
MKTFRLNDFEVGGQSLCVIAGPCLAESDDLCLRVAEEMVRHCADLGFPYIFKASFDKANRSSVATGRGDGLAAGLRRLENVKKAFGVPVTTDIHWPAQAREVAEGVDLLQIPAFLCRQSDLLQAAAETGRPVNVKKGQFLAPWDAKNIVDKLDHFGASGVLLTERGTSFGYNTLVVDMPGLEVMRGMGVPVCFDATHSAQRPGASGQETGGVRESIPAMARAAVAVGIDAIFLEVHPDPSTALSDRATQWPLDQIRPLLEQIAAVDRAVRAL